MELTLYFISVRVVVRHKDQRNARSFRLSLYLSTCLLVCITVFLAIQAFFGEQTWILNAHYPGGSAMYVADHATVWYHVLGLATSVVLNLISGGLLVRSSI